MPRISLILRKHNDHPMGNAKINEREPITPNIISRIEELLIALLTARVRNSKGIPDISVNRVMKGIRLIIPPNFGRCKLLFN